MIISDYMESKSKSSKIGVEFTSKIPKYIRTSFNHYCSKNVKPRFDRIDEIQATMAVKLQEHIFVDVTDMAKKTIPMNMAETMGMVILDSYDVIHVNQQISHEKVLLLFPNAKMYINDQSQEICALNP